MYVSRVCIRVRGSYLVRYSLRGVYVEFVGNIGECMYLVPVVFNLGEHEIR